jgi:hypothetical protein
MALIIGDQIGVIATVPGGGGLAHTPGSRSERLVRTRVARLLISMEQTEKTVLIG